MAFSRYQRDDTSSNGKGFTVAQATIVLRQAIRNGFIFPIKTITVTQSDRLDTLSGELYGDSRYWWVLAAASNIGWGLQVPPGTIISVLDLNVVERLVG
jgi:nucleoid-associated protein YgaU